MFAPHESQPKSRLHVTGAPASDPRQTMEDKLFIPKILLPITALRSWISRVQYDWLTRSIRGQFENGQPGSGEPAQHKEITKQRQDHTTIMESMGCGLFPVRLEPTARQNPNGGSTGAGEQAPPRNSSPGHQPIGTAEMSRNKMTKRSKFHITDIDSAVYNVFRRSDCGKLHVAESSAR